MPAPAASRAIHGLRAGGVGGTAKIDFFLFFIFGGIIEEKPLSCVGGELLNTFAGPGLRSRRPTVNGHLSTLFRKLKMTTTITPLAELRRQGFDADLRHGRIRVWPRYKMKKALALFVTANLPEITDALVVESNEKRINNVLLWDLPPTRIATDHPENSMDDAIPEHLNGRRFAGIPAPNV